MRYVLETLLMSTVALSFVGVFRRDMAMHRDFAIAAVGVWIVIISVEGFKRK